MKELINPGGFEELCFPTVRPVMEGLGELGQPLIRPSYSALALCSLPDSLGEFAGDVNHEPKPQQSRVVMLRAL